MGVCEYVGEARSGGSKIPLMTTWEKFFDEKVRLVAEGEIVVDLGGARGYQKLLSPYRGIFKQYKTLDYSAATNPDIVGDVHSLPMPDQSVDGILSIYVLEHVEHPEKVFSEMFRVLKKGGRALVCAPFLHPYHPREGDYNYPDYFRYTSDGLRFLARDFQIIEITPVKLFFETWLYLLPNPFCRILSPTVGRFLDAVFKPRGNQTLAHYLYIQK
jgi:SAM-dependent methyltransferase